MRSLPLLVLGLATLLIQIFLIFVSSAEGSQTSKVTRQTVTGTVTDALGRPLAGANVELQNSAGKTVAKAKSDAEGRFTFADVAPGVYAVVAKKATFKPATSIVSVAASGAKPLTLALQSEAALSMAVVAQRLNKARNSLSPETGGSVYRFSEQAIKDLPQGNNTALNDVLLQAPGVVQDSFGQLHVRGDHANLQYRINGVQLPEGITGFGQVHQSALCAKHKPADRRPTCRVWTTHRRRHRHQDQGRIAGKRRRCRVLRWAALDDTAKLRVWRFNRQVQLLRDGPVPQHHPRCRAADSGAVTDSRPVLPGPGVRLFFVFSEPHHTAQSGNGFGREPFPDRGESWPTSSLCAIGRSGLSVGGHR